jgi:hypothetical protein
MEKKVRISPLRSLLFLFLFSVTWGLMELAGTWVLDGSWFLSRIVCPCSPTLCLICGLLIDSCSCSSSAYVSTGRLLLLDFSKNAAGVALFSLPNMFPSDRIIGFPFFRCSHLQWRRFSSGYARLENLRYASIFLFSGPSISESEGQCEIEVISGMSKRVDSLEVLHVVFLSWRKVFSMSRHPWIFQKQFFCSCGGQSEYTCQWATAVTAEGYQIIILHLFE